MRERLQMMTDMFRQRYEQKNKAYDLFNMERCGLLTKAYEEETKTVYISGYAFPTELLWAFDVVPFDFEIAANNLPEAIGGRGSTLMACAENMGYSKDICSFHRLELSCLHQDQAPIGDLYVTSSYYCHGKAKIQELAADYYQKEYILFDVPHVMNEAALKYTAAQLKDIAARLEAVTGQVFDMDRLKESLRRSNQARSYLKQINECLKLKPCPWDGTRACLLALGGGIFWGSDLHVEIHRRLVAEIAERIESGKALPETRRVLWVPWVPVQQTNIFPILKENQVSVVMAEAAQVWWSELDENRPFEALARKALESYMVGPAEDRVRRIVKLARDYQVDGIIHFITPACYHENASTRLINDALREAGLPVLDLDGDMTDERNYSPQRTQDKLTAFLDIL